VKQTEFIRLDALEVQRRLSFEPEVPQLARDLRRRDAVRVVRYQAQQEHAVVAEVVLDEPEHELFPLDRLLPVLGEPVVAVTGLHAVPHPSPEMVSHEANTVLRYQRPNEPYQETETYQQQNLIISSRLYIYRLVGWLVFNGSFSTKRLYHAIGVTVFKGILTHLI